jgi:hypothetical protein
VKTEIEGKIGLLGGIVPVDAAFDPVRERELRAIEAALGVSLPHDYREFLQTYGCCSFGALVQFCSMEGDGGPLSLFFGSKSAGCYGLMRNIKMLQDRMPETIIPIGDDGGGNKVCLGIKGDERGKVYYWDHNNEWDEDDYLEEYGMPMPPEAKFQNVCLVAESFEDFIQRLEKTPEV